MEGYSPYAESDAIVWRCRAPGRVAELGIHEDPGPSRQVEGETERIRGPESEPLTRQEDALARSQIAGVPLEKGGKATELAATRFGVQRDPLETDPAPPGRIRAASRVDFLCQRPLDRDPSP